MTEAAQGLVLALDIWNSTYNSVLLSIPLSQGDKEKENQQLDTNSQNRLEEVYAQQWTHRFV